jgi:hypothetical protein
LGLIWSIFGGKNLTLRLLAVRTDVTRRATESQGEKTECATNLGLKWRKNDLDPPPAVGFLGAGDKTLDQMTRSIPHRNRFTGRRRVAEGIYMSKLRRTDNPKIYQGHDRVH